MAEASGLTPAIASLTVLKTGSPRCVVPPFLGVTPGWKHYETCELSATTMPIVDHACVLWGHGASPRGGM